MVKESLNARLAKKFFAPPILKLLKPFTAEDMSKAINGNLDLSRMLSDNLEYLENLRSMVAVVPFKGKIASYISSRKWVVWFINNEMMNKRKDLYLQVAFNPRGVNYIVKQIKKIVDLIFSG